MRRLLFLAVLAAASVLSSTAAHARQSSAPGIVRVRNGAQLPIAAFALNDNQRLADKHILPGRSVDIPVRTPGTYLVTCMVGTRNGTIVDIIFYQLCRGTVTVRAGEITVYEVPRVAPAQVLSHANLGLDGGDPAFGGRGNSAAIFRSSVRVVETQFGTSARPLPPAMLVFSPTGEWSLRKSLSDPIIARGMVSLVSWATMSTRYTFSLDGKVNVSIDRPYCAVMLPNGPSSLGTLSEGTFVTYTFCGFTNGAESSMVNDPKLIPC